MWVTKIKILKPHNTLTSTSKYSNNDTTYILSYLKPAGTKLIVDPKTNTLEILKLTLLDLVLKQVLVVKKEFLKSHSRDPHLREYMIVETGKNFANYKPDGFEKHFTDILDEDSYFQLKLYIRTILNKIPSTLKYKQEIIKNLQISNFFKNGIMTMVFSKFNVNRDGKKLQLEIKNYLNKIDNTICDLILQAPELALELVTFLQGNVFLLHNLQFKLLKEIKTEDYEKIKLEDTDAAWQWTDFINLPELSLSDTFISVSELLETTNDYFNFDSDGDWGSDFDFDFDFD